MKKLAALIALVAALTMLTMAANAAEEWSYRLDGDGFAHITGYRANVAALRVPDAIDGYAVVGIDENAIKATGRAKSVTVPVTVMEFGENAIDAKLKVRAYHGAPALDWAEDHGRTAQDISAQDFSEAVIDLTGSDYAKVSGGYSLSVPLGRLLQDGRAVYLPETGSAWTIDSLTLENGRYIASVTDLEPVYTYEEVIIRVNEDGPKSRSASAPVFDYTLDERLTIRPTGRQNRNVNAYITFYNFHVSAHFKNNVKKGGKGYTADDFETISDDTTNTGRLDLESLTVECDYDVYYENTTTYSALSSLGYDTNAIDINFTIKDWTLADIYTLSFDANIHRTFKGSSSTVISLQGNHLGFTYANRKFGNLSAAGDVYYRVDTLIENSCSVSLGLNLGLLGQGDFNFITLGGVSVGLNMDETVVTAEAVDDCRGMTNCRDVTCDFYLQGTAMVDLGVDFSSLFNDTATYWTVDKKLANGWHFGFNLGTKTSSYLAWDTPKLNIDVPICVTESQSVRSGETKHFELVDGKYVAVDECTRHRRIIMDSGLEGVDPVIHDVSDYANYPSLRPYEWIPSDQNRKFLGWYDENGVKFFYDNIGAIHFTGDKYLTAKWEDTTIPYPEGGSINLSDLRFELQESESGGHHVLLYGITSNPQETYDTYAPSIIRSEGSKSDSGVYTYYGLTVSNYKSYPIWVSGRSSKAANVVIGDRVTYIENYYSNNYLKSITISDSVGECPVLCKDPHLEWVILPSNTTSIPDYAFCFDYNLDTVEIPSGVTYIGHDSFNSTAIPKITIPAGVKTIESCAFISCSKLKEVIFEGPVDTIKESAFANCTSLKNFSCEVNKLENNVFEQTPFMETLEITSDNLDLGGDALSYCGARKITINANSMNGFGPKGLVNLEELTLNVDHITENVFLWNDAVPNLKKLTINCVDCAQILVTDSPVETIVINNQSDVENFSVINCPHLRSIHCGDVAKECYIAKCAQLTELDIGAIRGTDKGVLSFQDLYSLEEVEIADGTADLTNGSFINCWSLHTLILPGNMNLADSAINVAIPNVKRRASALYIPADGEGSKLTFINEGEEYTEPWNVEEGSEVETPELRRTGGVFMGWAVNGDLNNIITAEDAFVMPDEDVTLYAVWSKSELETLDDRGYLTDYGLINGERTLSLSNDVQGIAGYALRDDIDALRLSATVTGIDADAFANATSLQVIEVDSLNTAFHLENGGLYHGTALIAVPRRTENTDFEMAEGTTRIGDFAFGATDPDGVKSSIRTLCIPDSVTELGDGWHYGLADNCEIYGPVDGIVAEECRALGFSYNQFPAFYISGEETIALLFDEPGAVLPQPTPIKLGMAFLGWSDEEDGEPLAGDIEMPYGGIALFAQWGEQTDYDAAAPVLTAPSGITEGDWLDVTVRVGADVDGVTLTVRNENGEAVAEESFTPGEYPFRTSLDTAMLYAGEYTVDAETELDGETHASREARSFTIAEYVSDVTLRLDGLSVPLGGDLPFTVSAPGAEQIRVMAELPDGTWDGEWTFDGESGEGTVWWWSLSDHIVYAQAMFDGEWSEPGRMFTIATECYGALTQPSMDFPAIAWAGADIDFTLYADQVDSCWYTLEVVDAQSGEWIMQGDYGEAGANTLNTVRDDARLEAGHIYNLYLTQWAVGYEAGASEEYIVAVIDPGKVFTLPKKLKTIEEEAFTGINTQLIVVPDGVTQIGARAFADSPNLIAAVLPDSLQNVDSSVFEGCGNPFVIGNQVP